MPKIKIFETKNVTFSFEFLDKKCTFGKVCLGLVLSKKWSYVILQKFLTALQRPTLLAWLTYKVGKWLPSKSARLSLFSALSIFQMCSRVQGGKPETRLWNKSLDSTIKHQKYLTQYSMRILVYLKYTVYHFSGFWVVLWWWCRAIGYREQSL